MGRIGSQVEEWKLMKIIYKMQINADKIGKEFVLLKLSSFSCGVGYGTWDDVCYSVGLPRGAWCM